jgi:uncharacterized DUF497 family protein
MDFEWDETKCRANEAKHGVSFEVAALFDWQAAVIDRDDRRDYGEERYLARGYAANGIGYSIVFTMRETTFRIISMRPFNRKEELRYGQPDQTR